MVYYNKKDYKLVRFEKSKKKNKMYTAILKAINKKNKEKNKEKLIRVDFGDPNMENYTDKTGLNIYNHLIHNDPERRKLYKLRHKVFLKKGYYSPSYFSWYYLW